MMFKPDSICLFMLTSFNKVFDPFISTILHYRWMNLCRRQTLPEFAGPPFNILVKPDAVPVAVHTPVTIPIH